MMNKDFSLFYFFPSSLLILCVLFLGSANDADASISSKQMFKHLTVADGLAQNTVKAIHQDNKGFMWFGTNDGLSRFDGYEFVNYTENQGLSNTDINDIVEDQ